MTQLMFIVGIILCIVGILWWINSPDAERPALLVAVFGVAIVVVTAWLLV